MIDNTVDYTPATSKGTSTIIGGTAEISKLSIIVKGGAEIVLRGQFSNITIEEDIFASSIAGTITIVDTAGFLENFELRGGEIINLKVIRPDTGDIIIWREDLVVHKISKSEVDLMNLHSTYDLYFVSRTHVRSLKKSLFKSYSGMTYVDAVKNIYAEMSPNDLIMEDPKLTLTKPFISTGLMPHKAIDFLAQRSCVKNKFYVFFERLIPVTGTKSTGEAFAGSHYFGSIESLIEQAKNETIKTIYFLPKLDSKTENGSIIRTPIFEREENFNHVQAMLLGFYNTTITTIDPISRTHSQKKFGYTNKDKLTDDFYENKLIDDYNIFSTYNDFAGEIPGRKLIVSSVNDTGDRSAWMPNHINGQVSKSLFKIKVEIQGGTNDIGVGNIVNFFVPSQSARVGDAGNPFPPSDDIHSGRYLVTGVDHRLRDGEYIKTLYLSRGSSPIDQNQLYNKNDAIDFAQTPDTIKKSLGDLRFAEDLDNSSIVANWRTNRIPT